jgi:predicted extracellular nuclease
MKITVGTFNVENLFSRYDFAGALKDGVADTVDGITTITFQEGSLKKREYRGSLLKEKPEAERKKLAKRIKKLDLDVLAVVEVEDLPILKKFVEEDLEGLYPHVTLIEGNDSRLIDVGVLSKFPFGPVTSWKHVPDPDEPSEPVFGRDLLQVEIQNDDDQRLFTLFVNHLKSKLVIFNDPTSSEEENNRLRKRQAEAIKKVITSRLKGDENYIITGDMNDDPDAATLAAIRELEITNALTNPKETKPYPFQDEENPPTKAWTYRHRAAGETHFERIDHIWLSPSLAAKPFQSFIDRRQTKGGDGSDHDLAWVEIDM